MGKRLTSHQRTRISVLLTTIALALWSHSIVHAHLEIGFLGLVHGLPLTFFIALSFLALASSLLWTSPEDQGKLLLLQLVILMAALSLIPPVTGGSPPLPNDMYRNLGLTNFVAYSGGFGASQAWYLGYPGVFLLAAAISRLAALRLESLLSLIAFFLQLLYLPPLYIFLRNLLGNSNGNQCWAGCWLFYLGLWLANNYFAPQFMAFLYFLMLLALLTSSVIWERNPKGSALALSAALIFAALAVTHLLTALAALLVSGAISLIRRSKRLAALAGIAALLIISWDLTAGWNYLNRALHMPLLTQVESESSSPGGSPERGVPQPSDIQPRPPSSRPGQVPAKPGVFRLDPELIAEAEVTSRLGGSESHRAVARIRIVESALFACLALAGLIYTAFGKSRLRLLILLSAMGAAPLPLLLIGAPYGGELLQRVYLFTLPTMACLGTMPLPARGKAWLALLCGIILAALPLHAIARYGNQELDYFSREHIVASDFFATHTTHGYVTLGADRWRQDLYTKEYALLPFRQVCSRGDRPTASGITTPGRPQYVYIGRRERAYFEFYLGEDEFIEDLIRCVDSSPDYLLVYDNPESRLWVRESP